MTRPVAWTIAGTDPSGGAGIQADLKTMQDLGVHGCAVITSVIAQNTRRVAMIEFPSDKMLSAQLAVLAEDVPPRAIKIGMLGTMATVNRVADFLRQTDAFVVYDPVMASSTGARLLEPAAISAVIDELLPRVNLLTPNLPESAALAQREVRTPDDMEEAARRILGLGVKSVLVKGGHLEGGFCQDFWTDGTSHAWLTCPRRDTPHTHGSGCTLSSALAAAAALGYDPLSVVVIAKAYVSQGIRLGGGIGTGHGPVAHEGWPADPEDLPWITPTAQAGRERPAFPDCGPNPLGLYPLVDRAAWLERLLALGITTIQLRIKDLAGEDLEREIRRAVDLAHAADCRLFVNDYWEAACRCGAYGVHLGQSDLATADLRAIAAAGLRLGLTTQTYADLARASAVRPSYIAVGAVFPSPSKPDLPDVLGVEGFARLCRLSPARVVAIGGMTLERAPAVRGAGADGIAVISDLATAADLPSRVRGWVPLFEPV